jgi:hypothetical protein
MYMSVEMRTRRRRRGRATRTVGASRRDASACSSLSRWCFPSFSVGFRLPGHWFGFLFLSAALGLAHVVYFDISFDSRLEILWEGLASFDAVMAFGIERELRLQGWMSGVLLKVVFLYRGAVLVEIY